MQVCTAQALRAGILHDQAPADLSTPDAGEVPRDWMATEPRGCFAVTIRRTTLCDHVLRPRSQRLPSRSARTAASLMSLRFVAVSRVSRP
jgi:hypothetical protein